MMKKETLISQNPAYEGFEDRQFETEDHVKLHYMVKGKGDPLVFIPGWSGDSRDFMFNAPVLAENYKVYVLDMRGHGYSEAPFHGARIARLSKDLKEFIDAHFKTEINLVAYSMGCTVVWSYIDLFGQDQFRRLVFVDEPPFLWANPADSEEEVLLHGGNRMDLWKLRNAVYEENGDRETAFGEAFRRGENKNRKEAANTISQVVKPPFHKQFLANLLRDHISQDWRDVFPLITVPVLLVSGEIGHATTHESCEWMQKQMKNCKWTAFTEKDYGTHGLMHNSPELFNSEVLEFLN